VTVGRTVLGVLIAARTAGATPAVPTPAAPAVPPPVAAPSPDPGAIEQADDANLESTSPRAGFSFGAALGGSVTLGRGAVGSGGGISLRLGHVATPHTSIIFELMSTSYFHKPAQQAATAVNETIVFMTGAQVYTGPSLWLRGGLGAGSFIEHAPDVTHFAVGGVIGAGVDVARWRRVALGIEAFGAGLIDREGLLVTGLLGLGVTYY
jgi:hypothetical protein